MAADLNNRAVIFETDASNNTATDPGWPEGMLPGRVNDGMRALQGALARDWDRRGPTVTSGGSANAQSLTYTVAQTAIVRGDCYGFIAGFSNTAAMTLAVSGLTAKAVRLANAALTGGEIVSGQTYVVMYDGTAYQLVSPVSTGRGGLIGRQVFSTAGTSTYTPTAGANTYYAQVWGSGAGGGGCALTGAAQVAVGAPGGSGGYAEKRGAISAISGATITVGAGGAGGTAGNNAGTNGASSSIGAVVVAAGGSGGVGSAAGAVPTTTGIGTRGTGTTGDLLITGSGGQGVINTTSAAVVGSRGGASPLGYSQGGIGQITTTGSAGAAAPGFGGGGSGAVNAASQGAGLAGGAGSDGLVIIWEYA